MFPPNLRIFSHGSLSYPMFLQNGYIRYSFNMPHDFFLFPLPTFFLSFLYFSYYFHSSFHVECLFNHLCQILRILHEVRQMPSTSMKFILIHPKVLAPFPSHKHTDDTSLTALALEGSVIGLSHLSPERLSG